MPVDELVKCLELLRVSVAQPLSNLGQLSPDRSFLVPVKPFDLHIALIPQEINDLVDSLVVDCLNDAAIDFGEHGGKLLSDIVIVDAVLAKRKSNILLLFVLLFLLLF